MNELTPMGPEAKAAIAAEMHAPGAENTARKRLRDRLWTALAIAPIVPPAALPPGAALHGAAAGAGHSVLTTSGRLLALVARYPGPVVAASLTMGGLGGVAIHAELGRSLARQSPPAASATRTHAPQAFSIATPPVLSSTDVAAASLPESSGPAAKAPSSAHRESRLPAPSPTLSVTEPIAPAISSEPTAEVPQPSTDADVDLAAEAALLERARAALARGWTDPALSSLDQPRTRFPDGQLLEEREALSVLALARAGRVDESLRHAAAFERQFPGSLWREQVETVLPRQP